MTKGIPDRGLVSLSLSYSGKLLIVNSLNERHQ